MFKGVHVVLVKMMHTWIHFFSVHTIETCIVCTSFVNV
ncbi:unnamed protein product [Brassica oleracea]